MVENDIIKETFVRNKNTHIIRFNIWKYEYIEIYIYEYTHIHIYSYVSI